MACLKIPFFAFLITAIAGILGFSLLAETEQTAETVESVEVVDVPPLENTFAVRSFAVSYPQDWVAEADTPKSIVVGNSPAVLEKLRSGELSLAQGEMGILILSIPPESTESVEDLLEMLQSPQEETDGVIGEAETIENGIRAPLRDDVLSGYIYIVEVNDLFFLMFTLGSPIDEVNRIGEAMLQTIEVIDDSARG
jgi:hypothetical protein